MFYTLSIGWDAPDNTENFDLEYYIVQVVVTEPVGAIYNGTTTEHVYVFDLNQPVEGSVTIHVTAVNKCAQYSQTTSQNIDTTASAAKLEFQSDSFQNSAEGEFSHISLILILVCI